MPCVIVCARTTIPRTIPRYSETSYPSRALPVVTATRCAMSDSQLPGTMLPVQTMVLLYFVPRRPSLVRFPAQHRLLGRPDLVGPAQGQRLRRGLERRGVLAVDADQGVGEGVQRL